ncbi:Peroxisome chaperone and import receptor [Ceratobasidium sp. 370]|nr:Peroxisome chaperone and import receptor [Ceratobasidium sp. 370]
MTAPPPASGKAPAPAQPKGEEEDLDELDDLLDQFTPAPSSVPPTTKIAATPTNPASDAFSEDFEAALAREMEAMMRGAEAEGDEGLQGMIENMMGQLMGKEILYEPLVELDAKFPGYFDEHPELSEEDKKKFKSQQALVKRIIAVFERPNYSDDNPEMSKEVLELMNQMQELGSPPAEILGEMPPGFDLNAEGMPKIPDMEQCVIT